MWVAGMDKGGAGKGVGVVIIMIVVIRMIIIITTAFCKPLTRIAHSLLKAMHQQSPQEFDSAF